MYRQIMLLKYDKKLLIKFQDIIIIVDLRFLCWACDAVEMGLGWIDPVAVMSRLAPGHPANSVLHFTPGGYAHPNTVSDSRLSWETFSYAAILHEDDSLTITLPRELGNHGGDCNFLLKHFHDAVVKIGVWSIFDV